MPALQNIAWLLVRQAHRTGLWWWLVLGDKVGAGGWLSTTQGDEYSASSQNEKLPHRHSTGVWLIIRSWRKSRGTALPVTTAWLRRDSGATAEILFSLITIKTPNDVFMITSWSLTRKSHLSAPLSSTEMKWKRYAGLQGDLVVFDGLTLDFALVPLSCRQLPEHSLKDKTS